MRQCSVIRYTTEVKMLGSVIAGTSNHCEEECALFLPLSAQHFKLKMERNIIVSCHSVLLLNVYEASYPIVCYLEKT